MCAVRVVVGAAAGFACSRLVGAIVFGIDPWNSLVLSVDAAVLVLVALAAPWVPARRAASVDPMLGQE